jgi:hypothetical protein
LGEINELKECMTRAPLTFGTQGIDPSQEVKFDTLYGTAYLFDVLALRYQYKRKVTNAVKKTWEHRPMRLFPEP